MEWWFTDLWNFYFVVIVLLLALFYYGRSTYNYWDKMGIIYKEPKYPLFGNSFETTFSIKSVVQHQRTIYDFFKGNPFGGIYEFRKPVLFLRDPQMIDTVLIKDFQYFYNRGTNVNATLDPLSVHLIHLKNEQWKNLRSRLTPVFSSGKLKGMHGQLLDCTDELIKYMDQYSNSSPFEAKEIMANFTTDVIASCAFGLNVNAIKDSDSEFRKIGRQLFRSSFINKLRISLRNHFTWLIAFFKWRSVTIKTQQFFENTINETLEHREKHKMQRHDFLHLLNEIRKQDLHMHRDTVSRSDNTYIFDTKALVANAFVFFLAGFETTSSTLSYALYELAINEDIQAKAYNEIVETIKEHGGEYNFEAIKGMDYLDQIISETLRKYPPVAEIKRMVSKTYRIPDSSFILEKDTLVSIPIHSLHHDVENFPDPERFIPARFSKENKGTIKKGTYLPFGDGPRICIGMRFAKQEMKAALAKILIKYKVSLDEKTLSPLQYDTKSIFLVPIGGIWVNIKNRNSFQ